MHISNVIILVVVSLFTVYSVSKLSFKFDLLDKPNKRKIHNKSTAFTGGIAISIILIFSNYFLKKEFQFLKKQLK